MSLTFPFVLAMAQPGPAPSNLLVPAVPVRADDRHLLSAGADADAEAAEEGAGLPGGAQGRRPRHHDRAASTAQVTQARRRQPCRCRSPTRSESRWPARPSAATGPGAGRASRSGGQRCNACTRTFAGSSLSSLAVTALAVWAFIPPRTKIQLGLDLQGGVHLVLRSRPTTRCEVETETAAEQLTRGAEDAEHHGRRRRARSA